ncbi:MAG TPA: dihydroorotate dehydrogenase electron transfer subunit [Bacteroidales bacterium]|nr:dihydroorotate dehydrogenase electron transfer subunit [Bacteroidales bacterium]HQD34867.1 dihydroorotate dehydrogenase electron transfer subunit [Bacteroidales bacterium]
MNNKKIHTQLIILDNEEINNSHFRLHLDLPADCPHIQPGQFAEFYVPPTLQSFLRIPLSIHFVSENEIQFLIQIKGEGTQYLKTLQKSNKIDTILPLGKGFTIPKNKKVALIGGGCGIAPLLFLSNQLAANNNLQHIFLGFKNDKQAMLINDFKKYGELIVSTDDGSFGDKGVITDIFEKKLEKFDYVYSCGPTRMLNKVIEICKHNNLYCEVSLETLMGCGIGACLCCAVSTKNGNLRACIDGPVFDSNLINNLNF